MIFTRTILLTVGAAFLLGIVEGKDCPGEGWTIAGKKCIKLFPDIMTQEEGLATCESEFINGVDLGPPRLLQIMDETEQDYIVGSIFNATDLVPGVWLGARRLPLTDVFMWPGERNIGFSKWTPDSPTDNQARACAEMQSDLGKDAIVTGDWHDVTCIKGNWVVCEKYPRWSVLDMIDAIVDLQYGLEKLEKEIQKP